MYRDSGSNGSSRWNHHKTCRNVRDENMQKIQSQNSEHCAKINSCNLYPPPCVKLPEPVQTLESSLHCPIMPTLPISSPFTPNHGTHDGSQNHAQVLVHKTESVHSNFWVDRTNTITSNNTLQKQKIHRPEKNKMISNKLDMAIRPAANRKRPSPQGPNCAMWGRLVEGLTTPLTVALHKTKAFWH